MTRILRLAGAPALALMTAGLVTACDPDDVTSLAIPAVKAAAVKVAIAAAAGDTKSRQVMLSVASGYCEVGETDRLGLRAAFTDAGGRPAFTVDCAAVRAVAGRMSAVPPIPEPRPFAVAALDPDPHRRE